MPTQSGSTPRTLDPGVEQEVRCSADDRRAPIQSVASGLVGIGPLASVEKLLWKHKVQASPAKTTGCEHSKHSPTLLGSRTALGNEPASSSWLTFLTFFLLFDWRQTSCCGVISSGRAPPPFPARSCSPGRGHVTPETTFAAE